jgi:hypothetical protein
VIVSSAADVKAAVVDEGEADSEDGDLDLLLDSLVLTRRVGQVIAKTRILGEKLQSNRNEISVENQIRHIKLKIYFLVFMHAFKTLTLEPA